MNKKINCVAVVLAFFSSFSAMALNYDNVSYQTIESLRAALNNAVYQHATLDAARAVLDNMNADSIEQAKLSIMDPEPRKLLDQLLQGSTKHQNIIQVTSVNPPAVIQQDSLIASTPTHIDESANPHISNPDAVTQVSGDNQSWSQTTVRPGYDGWSANGQNTGLTISGSQMKMDEANAQAQTINEGLQNAVAQADQRNEVSRRLSAQTKEQINHNQRFSGIVDSKFDSQLQQAGREAQMRDEARKGEALTKANQQRTRQQIVAGGVAEVNAQMQQEAQARGEALTKANQQRTRQQIVAGGVAEVNAQMQQEARARGEALTKANQQRTRQQIVAGGVAEVNAQMQQEARVRGEALEQANRERAEAQNAALNAARNASLAQHESEAAQASQLAAHMSQVAEQAQREAQQAQAALTSAKYAAVSEGQAQQAMRDLTAAKYAAINDNVQIAHQQIQALEAAAAAKSLAATKAQAEAQAAIDAQNTLNAPTVGQLTPVNKVPAIVTNIPAPVMAKVFVVESSHNNGGQHRGTHNEAASARNNGNSNAHSSAMGGRGQGGQRSGHSAAGNF